MGKQKKKDNKRQAAARQLAQEEAREELLALQAIFCDDLTVHDTNDTLGFSLLVQPHPGEALANYVSVTLVVRCVQLRQGPIRHQSCRRRRQLPPGLLCSSNLSHLHGCAVSLRLTPQLSCR